MGKEERKYIGETCYISMASKPELVNADKSVRIPLSATEYKVLSYFIDNANDPVYLDELAKHIWGINYVADARRADSLKNQISRIRKKLEEVQPGLQKCLATNYGLCSYTFEKKLVKRSTAMGKEERKYIGQTCYISMASKPKLVSTDESICIPLSVTEYKVLSYFIDNANTPVYLDELAKHIWGINYEEDGKDAESLKSHISRIRKKLEEVQPGLQKCLETNYGLQSYILRLDAINANP